MDRNALREGYQERERERACNTSSYIKNDVHENTIRKICFKMAD
ncbi:hypothetical protein NC651_022339 [Populus alba x Populus x berolinensis]|nr:hypothetical protein NC651_022339 [Populus alba x Populus x berolinensis]